MADRGPQKAGAYERPARMKGMIIGIVVLIALIILAMLFFSGRRAGAAAFGTGGTYPYKNFHSILIGESSPFSLTSHFPDRR